MTQARPFLTARWVHLAMLNYQVDPSILDRLVPAGTELDTFDGKTFVSMVGFQFLDTRVRGLAIPGHRSFEEVNLRFYVRREVPVEEREAEDSRPGLGTGSEEPETRRGVVFVKEIVPRRAIAWVARWLYNENYVALPMDHLDEIGTSPRPRVEYGWKHGGRRQSLSVRAHGEPQLPSASSEEAFITEHYWGYVRQRSGSTVEYRVEHPQWRVWSVTEPELDCDVGQLYGERFAPFLSAEPASAFLAEGSEVVVRSGVPLPD